MNAIERACAVAQQHAAGSEQAGRLDPVVVASLVEAGAFRIWVPVAYGGPGATIAEGIDTLIDIGRADGAAGWCAMISSTTALAAYRVRPDWAERIFADPASCTGGFGMPIGTATVVDGGLDVTGQWAWGSGIDHCTWIGGGVFVVDGHGNRTTAADGSTTPFVFFEPDDVELLDTWHVSGMRGTGSTDYAVTNAFVPDGRWAQFIGGPIHVEGAASRFSFFGALACGVASIAIGLGFHAIDELVEIGAKKPSGSSKSLAERAAVQGELAAAKAAVGQARSYLLDVADRAWLVADRGIDFPDDLTVELRLAATAAVQRSVEAVDSCYHAAGGGAVYNTSPIQRIFRDVHVATQHAMVARRTFEPLGRFEFGLPTSLTTL
ncbi:MAG: acyl-CoA dehydrogenase family protein [Acidimicrobiales bacterium]